MTTSRSILVLLAATALVGCSNESEPNTSGSGGSAGQGSGGSSSGNGGASATGGTTGGTTGSGGAGSGGAGKGGSGSGGVVGSGGASVGGQGGTARSGGATGSGGGTGPGGSGGGAQAGGSTGTAGAATGGTIGAGGAGGAGGAISAGGAVGSGGAAPAGGAVGSGGSGSGGSAGDQHWVGTWTASPYVDSNSNNTPPISLSNSVIRQVVHVSLGGSQIRVQFSNLWGNGSLVINGAHIALCKATPAVDSTIDTATDKALAFSGKANVTIAQGQEVWSDPIDFAIANQGNITITTSFGSVPSTLTQHSGSRTTSYFKSGGSTADLSAANMSSATSKALWFFISGIDVMADASAKGLVVVGDSITDGRGSDTDRNNRWTDIMAARLQGNAATSKITTMNQAIGATNLAGSDRTTAQSRFNRDVLAQSGVKYVIVLDGVNDIGSSNASFNTLKAAYDDLIKRAHDKGLLIFGATILPFGGNTSSGGYYSTSHESVRKQVNDYIKSGVFDGVIDFDAALTDGGNPPKLQAAYAKWSQEDGLHPGPDGYKKMGETVDLALFK